MQVQQKVKTFGSGSSNDVKLCYTKYEQKTLCTLLFSSRGHLLLLDTAFSKHISKNFSLYSCNKITTTQVKISCQNLNGFFSNISRDDLTM
jgi:hypothetical protein